MMLYTYCNEAAMSAASFPASPEIEQPFVIAIISHGTAMSNSYGRNIS